MNRRLVLAVIASGVSLAITAFLMLQTTSQLMPARIAHYDVSVDGRVITVTAAHNRLETIESSSVQESTTRVMVLVLMQRRSGTAPGDVLLTEIPFTLATPLGDRTVVDANGSPVPLKR